MAEFQAILNFPPAPKLDLFGKLDTALASEQELRGQELFFGKAQCASCHPAPYYTDKHTLQHPRFSNIFALGDASALPISKTGAAVRKQAPIVVANLVAAMKGEELQASYNGYTSCPLITGYGRLVMAEFDYDGQPQETFPIDQGKERLSMYLVKKYLLPRLYWNGMLKGRA